MAGTGDWSHYFRIKYKAESYEIFLGVSAVHFGDAMWRKWWLGTRMKPNWMLSTLASKNKTHLSARSVHLLLASPGVRRT